MYCEITLLNYVAMWYTVKQVNILSALENFRKMHHFMFCVFVVVVFLFIVLIERKFAKCIYVVMAF